MLYRDTPLFTTGPYFYTHVHIPSRRCGNHGGRGWLRGSCCSCNKGSDISKVSCNTLQHTATHGNTLQHISTQTLPLMKASHKSAHLINQNTATHCNTLQHTATQATWLFPLVEEFALKCVAVCCRVTSHKSALPSFHTVIFEIFEIFWIFCNFNSELTLEAFNLSLLFLDVSEVLINFFQVLS